MSVGGGYGAAGYGQVDPRTGQPGQYYDPRYAQAPTAPQQYAIQAQQQQYAAYAQQQGAYPYAHAGSGGGVHGYAQPPPVYAGTTQYAATTAVSATHPSTRAPVTTTSAAAAIATLRHGATPHSQPYASAKVTSAAIPAAVASSSRATPRYPMSFGAKGGSSTFHKYCEHCEVTATSDVIWQSHIRGKKHLKNLAQLELKKQANATAVTIPVVKKDPCSKSTSSTDSKGGGLVSKFSLVKPGPPSLAEFNFDYIILVPTFEGKTQRKCSLCCVPFTGVIHELTHLSGKRHKQGVRTGVAPSAQTATGTSARTSSGIATGPPSSSGLNACLGVCPYCSVEYSSISHKIQHESGKKHKRMLQMMRHKMPPAHGKWQRKRSLADANSSDKHYSSHSQRREDAHSRFGSEPYVSGSLPSKRTRTNGAPVAGAKSGAVYFSATSASTTSGAPVTVESLEKLQSQVDEFYETYLGVTKSTPTRANEYYERYRAKYDEYMGLYAAYAVTVAEGSVSRTASESPSASTQKKTSKSVTKGDGGDGVMGDRPPDVINDPSLYVTAASYGIEDDKSDDAAVAVCDEKKKSGTAAEKKEDGAQGHDVNAGKGQHTTDSVVAAVSSELKEEGSVEEKKVSSTQTTTAPTDAKPATAAAAAETGVGPEKAKDCEKK